MANRFLYYRIHNGAVTHLAEPQTAWGSTVYFAICRDSIYFPDNSRDLRLTDCLYMRGITCKNCLKKAEKIYG